MANEKFKKALHDALIPEYTAVMRDADDTAHEFSPEFEKRMKKLIKRRSKLYYKLINSLDKRIACIAVIICVVSSITIIGFEASRNTASDFIIKTVSEKEPEQLIIQSADKSGAVPQTIEELYDVTYDLSEYEVIHDEANDIIYWKIYARESEDDYIMVELKQYVKKHYFTWIYTAADSKITTIDINGHEALYYLRENIGFHVLMWDNGEYIIYLRGNLDKNTLIEIAKSVKKVEEK